LSIGEISLLKIKSKWPPFPRQNTCPFIILQRPIGRQETDPTKELRITGQSFVDDRHADQNEAEAISVEQVAQLFERCHSKAFDLINDGHCHRITTIPREKSAFGAHRLFEANVSARDKAR
jgi:hypothetical protein